MPVSFSRPSLISHARKSLLLVLALLMSACVGTAGPSKQELILGTWEGDFQGQSIVLTYSETEIAVEAFGVSFPYEWVDADNIRLDAMGQEVTSTVEFISNDEMVQRSPQGTQTLRRVQ